MLPAWTGLYGLPLPTGRREALFMDGVAIFRKWPLGWQRKKRPKRRGKTDKQNNNTDKQNNKKLPKNLQMSEKIAIFVMYLRINNNKMTEIMGYRINMTGSSLEDAQDWATVLREDGLRAELLLNANGNELWLEISGCTMEDAEALTAEIEKWTRRTIEIEGRWNGNYREELKRQEQESLQAMLHEIMAIG